jgi:hypothetical protein
MAFTADNFVRLSGANSNAGVVWTYAEANTLANIRGANYFDNAVATYGLADGDVIMIIASDGIGFTQMSVSSGAATVGESITSA